MNDLIETVDGLPDNKQVLVRTEYVEEHAMWAYMVICRTLVARLREAEAKVERYPTKEPTNEDQTSDAPAMHSSCEA